MKTLREVSRRLKVAMHAQMDANMARMLSSDGYWGFRRYGAGRFPHEGFTLTQAQIDEWKKEERSR
jgi:hypothetical protein